MTITIQAVNIGRIAEADLALPEGNLSFLLGHNRVGKTTLLTAVRAVLARNARIFGVTQQDASALVTRGHGHGSVHISNGDADIAMEWPGGKPVERGEDSPHASPEAAGLSDPLALPTAEWLDFLADLLPKTYEVTEAQIADRLREIGVSSEEAAARAKALVAGKSSWDVVEQHFSDAARDHQRDWARITRENWGSSKSAGWRPKAWHQELERLDENEAQDEISSARQKVVAAQVSDAAARVGKLTDERAQLGGRVRELRQAQQQKAGHDHRGAKLSCPKCETDLELLQGGELAPWVEPAKVDEKAAEKARAKGDAEIASLEEKMAALTQQIAEAGKPKDLPPEAVQAQERATALEQDLALHRQVKAAELAAEQARICREAAQACGPGGIRRAVLAKGVDEFLNPVFARWAPWLFGDDGPTCRIDTAADAMPLLTDEYAPARHAWSGDRSSTVIRTGWLLQLAVASIDGSAMIVLDDGDVVEPRWLAGLMDACAAAGITALVAVTRPDPAGSAKAIAALENAGGVHVVENGVVRRVREMAYA